MTTRSLSEIIDSLPEAERAQLSADYAEWYNSTVQAYVAEFDITEQTREFRNEEDVIVFFRAAFMWWYKKKPKISELIQPLDAMKTRTCLGQIESLRQRFEITGLDMAELKLNEQF